MEYNNQPKAICYCRNTNKSLIPGLSTRNMYWPKHILITITNIPVMVCTACGSKMNYDSSLKSMTMQNYTNTIDILADRLRKVNKSIRSKAFTIDYTEYARLVQLSPDNVPTAQELSKLFTISNIYNNW